MSDLHLGASGRHQRQRTYKTTPGRRSKEIFSPTDSFYSSSALKSTESTGMDYRVVLSVLLVTLSWRFMGTTAQSTTQNATTFNPTVGGTSSTNTTGSTVGGGNTTITTTTGSPGGGNTTITTTTGSPGGGNTTITTTTGSLGGGNATTAGGGNATTAGGSNATTAGGSNATTAGGSNATTAGGSNATNAVGSNTTVTLAGSSTTTTAAATTTPIPVATLGIAINRTGCGSKKLCVAQPSVCDPSTGNQCYFISAAQQSGQLYNFELSGQSDGYIAAALSTSTNQAGSYQAYICANNNGAVRFLTGTISNYIVSLTSLNVSNVKGAVSSGKIQCTFGATLPDTTRAAGYSLAVANGPLTNGQPGTPTFKIQTPVVNLSDPNANATNLISGAHPVAHQQSLPMTALLLTVTLLVFTTQ